ncbi:hypothetical protein GF359_09570 [candidate division WOR-3 bacterium]|uniref:Uncharacterized protein n=1 Tax=candidate division WOR-3 bacterium TaxID=2052148 RepID=A0A9D5KAX2_UNCW3|nr:hypothetical protein [candidate division WOR-3 bacterium]MBD3365447.1 hypothetical protein [candidate division WOR-3 bacterium]
MLKYLFGMLILAAGGVLLVTFGCGHLETSEVEIEVNQVQTATQLVHLAGEEPGSGSAAISFFLSTPEGAEAILIEREIDGSFATLGNLKVEGSEAVKYEDPGELTPGDSLRYRFLTITRGRTVVAGEYIYSPSAPINFDIQDTIMPDKGRVDFIWETLTDSLTYRARLMPQEVPGADTMMLEKTLPHNSSDPVRWRVADDRLIGGARYILTVKTELSEPGILKSVESSREFYIGVIEEEEEEEKTT